ncbi:hypothetical protein MMC34_008380, partial [Xylographa carneopallida]|nr:hypothetical protein [Xylographa carneopallida]
MSFITSLLVALNLTASLPQTATNGLSTLGTLNAPTLPDFLTDLNTPLPNGFPWGSRTANNTNPYIESLVPVTGVIRPYVFTISRGTIAPDGVSRSVILINGQFPGPTIEANWGDTIQLSNMSQWVSSLSISRCKYTTRSPVPRKVHRFTGTVYFKRQRHGLTDAQYAGGLFGPMVIHGPKNVPYDVDLGPILLSDYYHTEYFQIVKEVMSPNAGPPFSDNNLINGKMNFDCTEPSVGGTCTSNAGLSKFRFQTGKAHRLRLINSGAEGIQRFTVDNHTMTVMANDFVPVVPYETDVVTLGIGQRTDVIVKATGKPTDAVWMRSDLSANCATANQPHALAAIYYPHANTSSTPKSTATSYSDAVCGNNNLTQTVPFFKPSTPPPQPATMETIDTTLAQNASLINLWEMNKSSFRADYNSPVLLNASEGETSFPDEWNVYDFGFNTSIRLVVRNFFPASHPMHLHGHNFYVLSESNGPWDGSIVHGANPQRRDVQLLQPGTTTVPSHMVIQIDADNPG